MPRLLLSTFYFLLSTLSLLLLPASLRAESSLYIKPGDDQVRATERLHDFLDDIGYSVEYRDEDKDSLIIHQQQQKAHAILKNGDSTELSTITIAVHYEFNRNAAAANERALAANAINNAQYNMKVCVDEEVGDFYFEYTLPFDRYMRPRTFKSFADQAIARSYLMIMHHKELKRAFFGEDDAPDSARNADEADQDSDDEAMSENDPAVHQPAAEPPPSTPAPSSSPEQPSSPAASEPPAASAPTASSPSSSSVPVSPPSSSASPAPPEPQSRGAAVPPPSAVPPSPTLIPDLPPTTPASPAPSKKTRA